MKLRIDYPPRPEGSPKEQIQQLWDYLFRLAEALKLEYQGDQKSN